MILGKCTCGADCELHGPDCAKYVKPIGAGARGDWVHSCFTHRDELAKRCVSVVTDFDWDLPMLVEVKSDGGR